MRTKEIAPGSILQRIFIKERLNKLGVKGKFFIDVGSGNGYNSRGLLQMGMTGIGIDLNESACQKNKVLNQIYIQNNQYEVVCGNFFSFTPPKKVDIIFSSMVIEHFPDELVEQYFSYAKDILQKNGKIITIVLGSMKHWGIEDNIAGHFRRYSFENFQQIAKKHTLKINKISGLTYPLSNILFPISNYLVTRKEKHKLSLSAQEQTILSGNREVLFKTDYPLWMEIILNEYTLLPFHVLQKIFSHHPYSMVIYCEMEIT